MVKRILWILLDVAVAALILLGVWVINFKIPQKGVRAVNMAEEDTAGNDSGSSGLQNSGGTGSSSDTGNGMNGTELKQTRKVLSTQDWHEKFADKFTDTVVSTDTSYTSPNLSIQISHHQYDSGTVDNTHGGSYAKYGSKISYVLADIYIGDITCFQTAFAQDTYGIGYTEKLTDMSARTKSILSVNGWRFLQQQPPQREWYDHTKRCDLPQPAVRGGNLCSQLGRNHGYLSAGAAG